MNIAAVVSIGGIAASRDLPVNEYLEALADWPQSDYPFMRGYQTWPGPDGFDGPSRGEMRTRFAYAIPNDEAIAAVAALSPIVEVGAGTGFWAHCLAAAGADVVAYDQKPDGNNRWFPPIATPWHPVLRGPASISRHYPERTLFLCWPPFNERMAHTALHAYRGQRLAYVGEGEGGCTADQAFFDRLEAEWEEVREVAIPQWEGVHDSLVIYERRAVT